MWSRKPLAPHHLGSPLLLLPSKLAILAMVVTQRHQLLQCLLDLLLALLLVSTLFTSSSKTMTASFANWMRQVNGPPLLFVPQTHFIIIISSHCILWSRLIRV
ncbi:hypothetical protein B0O80DRAFT_446633, partial [Mortierella sp. GBAus27b]